MSHFDIIVCVHNTLSIGLHVLYKESHFWGLGPGAMQASRNDNAAHFHELSIKRDARGLAGRHSKTSFLIKQHGVKLGDYALLIANAIFYPCTKISFRATFQGDM